MLTRTAVIWGPGRVRRICSKEAHPLDCWQEASVSPWASEGLLEWLYNMAAGFPQSERSRGTARRKPSTLCPNLKSCTPSLLFSIHYRSVTLASPQAVGGKEGSTFGREECRRARGLHFQFLGAIVIIRYSLTLLVSITGSVLDSRIFVEALLVWKYQFLQGVIQLGTLACICYKWTPKSKRYEKVGRWWTHSQG